MTKIELETGGSVWKLMVNPIAGEVSAVHIAEGDAVEEDQIAVEITG